MLYFNFEDLSKIKKEQLLRILRVAVFVALAIIIGAIVYFQQRGPVVEKEKDEPVREGDLTEQQKKDFRESLSAPPSAPQYTKEERIQIMEGLAPVDQPTLSWEEEKAILKALSAPFE
jgi:hypothetical protein